MSTSQVFGQYKTAPASAKHDVAQSTQTPIPHAVPCPQPELEELLFDIMRSKGFGDQYVRRYRLVTAFHMQRRPLIVFIGGTACTGG